jgi:hypothetical protein
MGLAADTPIFMVDSGTYDWTDVRLAAWLFGDWARLETQLRAGLACLCFLDADESPLDRAVVETMADDFRHDRNLIAAEEMNTWLEARGLTVDEWFAFIERAVARRQHARNLESLVVEYPVAEDAMAAALECEAICSGSRRERPEARGGGFCCRAARRRRSPSADPRSISTRSRAWVGSPPRTSRRGGSGSSRSRRPSPRSPPPRRRRPR